MATALVLYNTETAEIIIAKTKAKTSRDKPSRGGALINFACSKRQSRSSHTLAHTVAHGASIAIHSLHFVQIEADMHGGISGCLAPLVQQPRPPSSCRLAARPPYILAFCRDKQFGFYFAPPPCVDLSPPTFLPLLQLYARRKNLFLKSAFDMCLLQASPNERDSKSLLELMSEREGGR